jgi:hypothetical protein
MFKAFYVCSNSSVLEEANAIFCSIALIKLSISTTLSVFWGSNLKLTAALCCPPSDMVLNLSLKKESLQGCVKPSKEEVFELSLRAAP